SFSTTEARLRELFTGVGTVESAAVVTDRNTGRSRGFGVVEMATAEEAAEAVKRGNGHTVDGLNAQGWAAQSALDSGTQARRWGRWPGVRGPSQLQRAGCPRSRPISSGAMPAEPRLSEPEPSDFAGSQKMALLMLTSGARGSSARGSKRGFLPQGGTGMKATW